MKKKCNVVMLATDKASIVVYSELLKRLVFNSDYKATACDNKHLYTISDDEIKEGDWFIQNGQLIRVLDRVKSDKNFNLHNLNNNTKGLPVHLKPYKIIATTNPELWTTKDILTINQGRFDNHYPVEKVNVPKISLDFVNAYIKAYNKREQIKEVIVEYEKLTPAIMMNTKWTEFPKVASNGTISITPVEERKYTREEVLNILDNMATFVDSSVNRSGIITWFNKHY